MSNWFSKSKFFFLFISLILLAILNPLIEGGKIQQLIFFLVLGLVPLAVVYAASHKKSQFKVAFILAFVFILTHISFVFFESKSVIVLDTIATIVLFGYMIFIIFAHIFKAKKVDLDSIFGAVSVYLLLGAIWSSVYFMIEYLLPGSFSGTNLGLNDFIYFSYVTLTTLGYGDILPVRSLARSLAVLEAIVGALYLAITIARLVSLYDKN